MATNYFRTSGVLSSTYDGVYYNPTLKIDFLNSSRLDPRFTFARTTAATRFNAKGSYELVAAETPRIDYDPVTLEKRGLFLEESKTNSIAWSADPNQAGWYDLSSTSVALTQDAIFTPSRVSSGGTGWHRRGRTVVLNAGTKYSITLLFKPGTSGRVYTELRYDSFNTYVVNGPVNNLTTTSNQGFTTNTAPALTIHKDGIYKLTYTITPSLTQSYSLGLGPDSSVVGEYVDFYGAQLEAGQAPSSFIVTDGTSLTRTREDCYSPNSEFSTYFNSSEATLICEHVYSPSSVSGFCASLYSSTTNYTALVYIGGSGVYSGVNYYVRTTDYSSEPPSYTYANFGLIVRSAVAYDSTGVSSYVNGDKLEHSGGTFGGAVTPTQLSLGARSPGDFGADVWIRKLTLYDRRLPDKDLLHLTTLGL